MTDEEKGAEYPEPNIRVGYRCLWLAVIEYAVEDYLGTKQRSYYDAYTARKFLFSQERGWREHRQLVCDMAGVDEAYIRRRAAEAYRAARRSNENRRDHD